MAGVIVPSVLLVCLGNICRSPIAEGLFAHHAERAGLDVVIDSAGCAGFHVNKAPDPRAIATAAAQSIDIAHLKARQVAVDDFYRFGEIYAMDEANLAELQRLKPADATAKLALVMSMIDGPDTPGRSVPDPYYGGQGGFDQVFEMLDQAAASWARCQSLTAGDN